MKRIYKELTPLQELEYLDDIAHGRKMVYDPHELKCDIEKELKILDYLKEICLDGKDKYGNGTWGWVEFCLDNHPQLKEWLKDE